jgi:D-serine deaminase-like pyridoxal phosphate-dependent protein
VNIAELDTPSLIVDLDRLQANIQRMAEIGRATGTAVRPHAKTHKIPAIGRMQIAAGSPGLTVAKLGEAEVFAQAGIEDLFIAYPLWGEQKWERLCRLAAQTQVRVAADSPEVVEGISRAAARHRLRIRVRLEVESGMERCGLQSVEQVIDLAGKMERWQGVELVGLMEYAGQNVQQPDVDAIRAAGVAEAEHLVGVAEALRRQGFAVPELSVAGTPAGPAAARVPGITEIRPGTYVFSDRTQVMAGWSSLQDCALTVLTTVVSRPTTTRAVVDAGSKTLSGDAAVHLPGYGAVVDHDDYQLLKLSEEHGVITLPESSPLPIGSRLRVVPNHVCACLNLHDRVYAVRGDEVIETWAVAARGMVQ